MKRSAQPKNEPNKITYHWGEEHLLVSIADQTPGRIKMLFWAEFLLTIGMTTIMLFYVLPAENSSMGMAVAMGSALVYLLAAYRFLSRLYYHESLILDKDTLSIVQKTMFNQRSQTFIWNLTGPVHYWGKAPKTDHPLKGQCFDYLGFETQEHLIQNLHDEGNLYFNYLGNTIRFARRVYSWDAEEMVRMMKLYAGNKMTLGPEWQDMQQAAYEWDENHQ